MYWSYTVWQLIWLLFHRVKWKNVYFMSAKGTNEIYIFFTSRDEIKVIFTTNIWIFFLFYTSLSTEEMQILHLQREVGVDAMTFMFCLVTSDMTSEMRIGL